MKLVKVLNIILIMFILILFIAYIISIRQNENNNFNVNNEDIVEITIPNTLLNDKLSFNIGLSKQMDS